ncbi:MAG: glycosyltransferase family 4 protein [Actinomycetota bacterium]
MKILVVNQYFWPDTASTSQLLTELCEDLAEHHEVTVVAGRPSYNPSEVDRRRGLVSRERHGRMRVLRTWSTSFHRSHMPGRLANYGTYLTSCIVGAMRAERPDVVLTMTDPPVVAAAAMVASRARRVPFVYVNQDVFPEVAVALGRLRNRVVEAGLRSTNKRLRASAARVVAIGRDMRQRLLSLGCPPSSIEVIPNWADGSAIRPLVGLSALRAREGWNDRFVVMHSGNVGLSQGLDAVIGAAEVLRDDEQIVFAIVGDGAARAALETRVATARLGNVRFLPYQPKADLTDSLGAADIHLIGLQRGLGGYIVPSKLYGIMAAGKPYVAAIDPDTEPALVAHEYGCGLRAEPDDPRSLADAIRRARTGPLSEMGAHGREAFNHLYDRPKATDSYRSLLEEVVSRG